MITHDKRYEQAKERDHFSCVGSRQVLMRKSQRRKSRKTSTSLMGRGVCRELHARPHLGGKNWVSTRKGRKAQWMVEGLARGQRCRD